MTLHMSDPYYYFMFRQPSYTSPVPQIGNGTSRGDYSHYAIQDAPGAQRDRAAASQAPPLFDSRHGTMPHPTMLVHLVQVFFECFSRNFPFLQFDDVSRRMFNGTLSPLLANSIASLAARYSQSSDVLVRGASAVSNAYTDVAKVGVLSVLSEPLFGLTEGHLHTQRLLHDSSHIAYIEILHAVIVLAWSEYKSGRIGGPTEYSQVCLRLIGVPFSGTQTCVDQICSRYGRTDGHQTRDEPGTRK